LENDEEVLVLMLLFKPLLGLSVSLSRCLSVSLPLCLSVSLSLRLAVILSLLLLLQLQDNHMELKEESVLLDALLL
jgi:hypothetical protein